MKKLIMLLIIGLESISIWGQWIQTEETVATNSNEVILNSANNRVSTLWLNNKNNGPTQGRGQYYIKAYDYWGASLHFVGTGDQDNERLNVTFDGNVGIGTDTPNYKLEVKGSIKANSIKANSLLLDDPNPTSDWNNEWQCGFFDGYNTPNSPEETNQWYWGINLGHRNNNSEDRYGGQVIIRNSSSSPVLYFRSRNKEGEGTWAKVLHNIGDQKISGNLTVDGVINSEEIIVEDIAANNINLAGDLAANNITLTTNGNTADFVFEPEYQLKDLTEVENFIKT